MNTKNFSFSSILIIPIPNDQPVLVFKNLGAPFLRKPVKDTNDMFEKREGTDFLVYWKKYLGHNMPDVVAKNCGEIFNDLIKSEKPTYFYQDQFPAGSIEMPVWLLNQSKIQFKKSSIIRQVRHILSELGMLKQQRGRKPKSNIIANGRRKFIIGKIPENAKRKDISISRLYKLWQDHLDSRNFKSDKEYKEYQGTPLTIRRIVDQLFKERQELKRFLKIYNK